MILAVDFDGTIVEHDFPNIGKEVPGAIETLKKLNAGGHKLILWTCREGRLLLDALEWCRERDVWFDAVNSNLPEKLVELDGSAKRKIYAHLYVDDRAFFPGWEAVLRFVEGHEDPD